jgi:hypothetical protein
MDTLVLHMFNGKIGSVVTNCPGSNILASTWNVVCVPSNDDTRTLSVYSSNLSVASSLADSAIKTFSSKYTQQTDANSRLLLELKKTMRMEESQLINWRLDTAETVIKDNCYMGWFILNYNQKDILTRMSNHNIKMIYAAIPISDNERGVYEIGKINNRRLLLFKGEVDSFEYEYAVYKSWKCAPVLYAKKHMLIVQTF